MRKQSGATSILSMLLIVAMLSLAGVMIWVVLSPYFGQQLHAPINIVSCQLGQSEEGHLSTSNTTPPADKSPVTSTIKTWCYKADDVFALNKALNMSDTIAMLGILLTVFAFIGPLFTYVTLTKERQSLENRLKTLAEDFKNKLVDDSKNKSEELKKESGELKKKLEEYTVKTVNNLPNILYRIELFKVRYQLDAPHGSSHAESEARDISLRLHSLLDRDTGVKEVLTHIESYIKSEAVLANKPHIRALKMALRELYDAGYFADGERKGALNNFLRETLNTSEAAFFGDTATG